MGMSETTGHTTTSNTTKSLTAEGPEMSQETDPRPIHRLSCTLTGTINCSNLLKIPLQTLK
jgi:hypothetical protein